jgi:hypothetical protein
VKYAVDDTTLAEAELLDLWINASDQAFVTSVVHHIELLLRLYPREVGEARESPLTRIVFAPPVGMWFDIIEDDLKVLILHVWEIK